MSRAIKGDPSTPEYWNSRAREIANPDDVLFLDGRRDEFWRRVHRQLVLWRDLVVLDVACGYGKFASNFARFKYTGIDFSEEMIKRADQLDTFKIIQADARTWEVDAQYDVIFEVNALRSLGWSAEQFFEKFGLHARVAVACFEADQFIIKQMYDQTKRN